jgi:hypothetical protein
MAQTKRKRRTKHRGTAAGTIESRGRTGRKPTAQEAKAAKGSKSDDARARRAARLDQPPTWRSAFNRALITTAIVFASFVLVLRQNPASAFAFAVFAMLLYIPMGYYTDLFIYRRRQARKAK